jgi:hypothetical protein
VYPVPDPLPLRKSEIKFYKIIAGPMLMYGSENWAPSRSEEGGKFKQHKCAFEGMSLNINIQTMCVMRQYAKTTKTICIVTS